jgi:Zn-dependent peptidase ImmA (M78 family)
MNLSKYMTLSEGEEVLQEIEGDAYNLDSSPIARMMGAIVRIISIALGIRKKTHLIVTNKRVVRINFEKVFWVIDKGVTAISMTARSINNVGYSNIRRLVIFKTSTSMPVIDVANRIKETIGWQDAFDKSKTKEDFIYEISRYVEEIGIMVMRSSYAGSATQHTIKVEELRGLAIADKYAPLIFLNSADTKSAQVFTLAHELVHIWIGESGISDLDFLSNHEEEIEKYCNSVAAEMLVVEEEFKKLWDTHKQIIENCKKIATRYYVSDFVVLKRAYDLGYIDYNQYRKYYEYFMAEWQKIKEKQKSRGGNYYNTKPAKESKRFSTAVVEAALEGRLFYRDAMELLNIKSTKTFKSYAKELGIG